MKRSLVKITLIVAAMAMRWPSLASAVSNMTASVHALAFSLVLLIFAVLLLIAAFVRQAWLRWTFAVVFSAMAFPVIAYEATAGVSIDYFQFTTLIDARSAAGNALDNFAGPIVYALVSASLLLIGIGLSFSRDHVFRLKWLGVLPPVAGLLTMQYWMPRDQGGMAGMPASWTGLAYSLAYVYDRMHGETGPRDKVSIPIVGRPFDGDVVYIVDESIAGQYLDINSASGVRSGLKEPRAGLSVHNFGLAASITNCSVNTNVNLRFGGTRQDYRKIIARSPSMWSYAKTAGYRTVYLYGQTGRTNENLMTEPEKADIDVKHYYADVPDIDRDQAIASDLAKYLTNGRREFIAVNKHGAHFPVNNAYPVEYRHYEPALTRNTGWIGEADFGEAYRARMLGAGDRWARYRNSYRNTVNWTVGKFFDTVFDGRNQDDFVMIYTSDHGQTFHERGNPGLATHCNADPQVEEMVVPLVAIERRKPTQIDFAEASTRNVNRSSQFRIFPTLLKVMGYQPSQVNKIYGDALDSPAVDPMTSAYQMHLHSLGQTKWIRVDPIKAIRPPLTDFQIPQSGQGKLK